MNHAAKTSLPVPQGNYLPATRDGDQIFTAGMTPRRDGTLILKGKVNSAQALSDYKEAVQLAAANALVAAKSTLSSDEQVGKVLHMTVYIAADAEFEQHAKLADFASEYLVNELGDAGRSTRAAIGVYTLPGNAPVEISLIASVAKASSR
ncbi:RidA family protein [Alcaligenaceae bacterium]|nr:RidA family protein [Alcaligenaceae bacterium]